MEELNTRSARRVCGTVLHNFVTDHTDQRTSMTDQRTSTTDQ